MIEWLLCAVESWPWLDTLRQARWGYAAVNTLHLLGIALLLGAIVPLDLRLLGAWPRAELEPLLRVLQPCAATGLALALASGALLFGTRAGEYAALPLFRVKLALIVTGGLHALWQLRGAGLGRASPARQRFAAALSLLIWLAVLGCGRFLAFVGD